MNGIKGSKLWLWGLGLLGILVGALGIYFCVSLFKIGAVWSIIVAVLLIFVVIVALCFGVMFIILALTIKQNIEENPKYLIEHTDKPTCKECFSVLDENGVCPVCSKNKKESE